MHLPVRRLSALCCSALLLAVASTAHAATFSVSGEVWENGTTTNVPAIGNSIYSSTPTASFTLTNTSASALFNFDSGNDVGLSSFLTTDTSHTSNGDTLTYITGSGAAGDNINNDLFEFQGTTALANGTYDFEHDDGLLLYLNGVLVVNEGGPTAATTTTLCVGTTGCDYNIASTGDTAESFTLLYAEVDGPPAVLQTNLPLTGPPPSTTPEPSSFLMLGSGLLAAAGMVRRRMMA